MYACLNLNFQLALCPHPVKVFVSFAEEVLQLRILLAQIKRGHIKLVGSSAPVLFFCVMCPRSICAKSILSYQPVPTSSNQNSARSYKSRQTDVEGVN